mgnify:CR=1 FL=1
MLWILKPYTSIQILVKVFKINDEAWFVIAKFNNKKSADKIKIMNNSEIKELITNFKIKSFEKLFVYSK